MTKALTTQNKPMHKSTRILLIAIGTLSILAGLIAYLKRNDVSGAISAFVIGSSVLGVVFMDKRE